MKYIPMPGKPMKITIDPYSKYTFQIRAIDFFKWPKDTQEFVKKNRMCSMSIPLVPKKRDMIDISLLGTDLITLSKMVQL